ncbi:MAG: hypothetical protein OXI17_10930 [Gammaproteobacteria bacterium]|nr:hypothetical protein [Gammaproteobacteria bacterium]
MERFRDVLTALRDRISHSLLAGEGWDRLLERVGDLPAAAACSLCGFEFRLDEPAPAADFSNPVSKGRVARHYIARGEAAAPESVEAWLAAHLKNSSATDHWLESVLPAYDIIAPPSPIPPTIYLRLRPGGEKGGIAAGPEEVARTVAKACARNDSEPERRALARALGALPAGARLAYVAATPNLAPRSVRLLAADIGARELEPLLKRLQWPGSTAAVDGLLAGMADLCGRFLLLCDINEDGALPRLGFEMHAVRGNAANYRALLAAWLTTSKSDWRPVIRRLVDLGWCLPAKAEGLLAWPGLRTVFGEAGAFQLYMGINHVKLSVDEGGVRAKAYGGLRLLPLDQFAKESFFGG